MKDSVQIGGPNDVAEVLANAQIRRNHPPSWEIEKDVYIFLESAEEGETDHTEIDSVVINNQNEVVKHGETKNSYDPDKIKEAREQNETVQDLIKEERENIEKIVYGKEKNEIDLKDWSSETMSGTSDPGEKGWERDEEEMFTVGTCGTREQKRSDDNDRAEYDYVFPSTKLQTKLLYETFKDARET
jgi:hypothetical protein